MTAVMALVVSPVLRASAPAGSGPCSWSSPRQLQVGGVETGVLGDLVVEHDGAGHERPQAVSDRLLQSSAGASACHSISIHCNIRSA